MDEYLTQIAARLRLLCEATEEAHSEWTLTKLNGLVNRIRLLRELSEINFN